jgi:hypothetical protein
MRRSLADIFALLPLIAQAGSRDCKTVDGLESRRAIGLTETKQHCNSHSVVAFGSYPIGIVAAPGGSINGLPNHTRGIARGDKPDKVIQASERKSVQGGFEIEAFIQPF